jgi:hypothetical protein
VGEEEAGDGIAADAEASGYVLDGLTVDPGADDVLAAVWHAGDGVAGVLFGPLEFHGREDRRLWRYEWTEAGGMRCLPAMR